MGSSAFEPLFFGSGGSMFSMARVLDLSASSFRRTQAGVDATLLDGSRRSRKSCASAWERWRSTDNKIVAQDYFQTLKLSNITISVEINV
jgi:hypothetical protein